MKICVLTAAYPYANSIDGIFIKEQCHAIARQGHEVVVLAALGKSRITSKSRIEIIDEKDYVCCCSFKFRRHTTFFPVSSTFIISRQFEELYRLCYEKDAPDVLYAHFSFPAGYSALTISRRHRIPLVVMEHWSGLIQDKAKGICKLMVAKTIEEADSFCCVSEALRSSLEKLNFSERQISVIPNMISDRYHYFEPLKKPNFVFFSLGMLSNRKGFDVLIRAFCKAFGKEERVQLRIGGDGPAKQILNELIESNGRNHQICLLGLLNRDETVCEYELCDCFVLASKAETFGIVYREAMACGRPVISTRNMGILQDWDSIMGYLVDVNDIDQLALMMRRMVDEYSGFDLRAISNYVRMKYSENAISQELISKFNQSTNC